MSILCVQKSKQGETFLEGEKTPCINSETTAWACSWDNGRNHQQNGAQNEQTTNEITELAPFRAGSGGHMTHHNGRSSQKCHNTLTHGVKKKMNKEITEVTLW